MISLLYIDPDQRLQKSLKWYLEQDAGITVTLLPSATAALDLIKTQRIDAIVSEYILPVTDGQTFLEILRRTRKETIPFIIFADKPAPAVLIQALNAGATNFVLKGKTPEAEFGVLKHFICQAVREHRIETKLRESEQRYRSVVEDQSEFIMRFLPDGTLVFVNEAYGNYFRVDRNAILGKNIFSIIPPLHRNDFGTHLAGLTRESPVRTTDSHIPTEDGKVLWQRWNNRAIFDSTGKVAEYQAVGRDITAQKIAETGLIQAHRNLGIMNTITRHDVLNQLTGIFGFLELARSGNDNPEVERYITKSYTAAQVIREQILFTKDYQQIGSDVAQWQNMELIVSKAVHGFDLPNIRIEISLANLWIFVDPLVEKVFYNLVENSRRHGGNVSLIRFSYEEQDDGLLLVYEDDGVGIPPGVKDKIFQREYFKHTGLGLYLIREILAITQIGIRETGTPGNGVRFEVIVPRGKYGILVEEKEAGSRGGPVPG
jgi:PAS domain S-box-containing protein